MNAMFRFAGRGLGALVVAAIVFGLASRAAAQPNGDSIEKLRRTLQDDTADLAERDRETKECLSKLRSLSDLRKAVLLREWRQFHPNAELASLDRTNRDSLNQRYCKELDKALAGNDIGAVLAALEMINETAVSVRDVGEPSLTRPLTAAVAELVGQDDPAVRASAARTLGQIDPDLEIALPALRILTEVPDAALRLDTARALGQMMQTAVQPWIATPFNPNTRLDRAATAQTAAKLLPLAGTGLADANRDVRQRGLTTFSLAASALGKMVTLTGTEVRDLHDTSPVQALDVYRTESRPLALALNEQMSLVGGCLHVKDSEGRALALQVIEETAQARLRWLKHVAATTPGEGKHDDPLATGLTGALPGLAETLTDDNSKVRWATLDVLEICGPLAAAAAPAVTRALKDSDRFVRWSAVRTLGNIGPAAKPAIPALSKLLQDPDADVRLAAAGVLEVLDPMGKGPPRKPGQANNSPSRTPLPALIQSLKSEQVEMRLAAIHALATMGPNAEPAVAALADTARDADAHVRLAAVKTLGEMGPVAKASAEALQEALKDNDADVRRAAGDALLNVQREP